MSNTSNRPSPYYHKLDNLYFDKAHLLNLINEEISPEDWYIFDCQKLRWTVHEKYTTQRSECTYFKRTLFFQELYELFTIPINYSDVIFTKTPPPGIPPHVDRNRDAAINIPITGMLSNSPMTFYSDFNRQNKIDEYDHGQISPITNDNSAVLFNPKVIHGVESSDDSNRCLLSIWWRGHSYEKILAMWKDGSLINSEINKSNKYIKYLSK